MCVCVCVSGLGDEEMGGAGGVVDGGVVVVVVGWVGEGGGTHQDRPIHRIMVKPPTHSHRHRHSFTGCFTPPYLHTSRGAGGLGGPSRGRRTAGLAG